MCFIGLLIMFHVSSLFLHSRTSMHTRCPDTHAHLRMRVQANAVHICACSPLHHSTCTICTPRLRTTLSLRPCRHPSCRWGGRPVDVPRTNRFTLHPFEQHQTPLSKHPSQIFTNTRSIQKPVGSLNFRRTSLRPAERHGTRTRQG